MARSYQCECLDCSLKYKLLVGATENNYYESFYCDKCEKVISISYNNNAPTSTSNPKCSICGNTHLKQVEGGGINPEINNDEEDDDFSSNTPKNISGKETESEPLHKCLRCGSDKVKISAPALWD